MDSEDFDHDQLPSAKTCELLASLWNDHEYHGAGCDHLYLMFDDCDGYEVQLLLFRTGRTELEVDGSTQAEGETAVECLQNAIKDYDTEAFRQNYSELLELLRESLDVLTGKSDAGGPLSLLEKMEGVVAELRAGRNLDNIAKMDVLFGLVVDFLNLTAGDQLQEVRDTHDNKNLRATQKELLDGYKS